MALGYHAAVVVQGEGFGGSGLRGFGNVRYVVLGYLWCGEVSGRVRFGR